MKDDLTRCRYTQDERGRRRDKQRLRKKTFQAITDLTGFLLIDVSRTLRDTDPYVHISIYIYRYIYIYIGMWLHIAACAYIHRLKVQK